MSAPPVRDENNPASQPGDRIGEFQILRISELKEIQAVFYELEHPATGARHIHVSRKDSENTFGVAFKTVPQDSTGVAHILEHTALCGSRQYPVRDPFFSMIKRSLNTFMNAFTASDWTMYPYTTQNRKDFYNLMSVYLDAAFFPNIHDLNFKQEGYRLEMENGEPVFRGVVFNEMKGAMSSPHQIIGRGLLSALFPDTTYRFNSGGDPRDIPDLTHEQLVAFHQRHYHPSNAYFFTYGDLPLKDHLDVIQDQVLRHFEKIDPKTEVPNQPRWDAPRVVSMPYPLASGEDTAKKSQVCLAWLTADIRDTFEVLGMALLGQILLANAASPLRKALIDSGLGSALSDGSGFDPDSRDTLFVCGLKDVNEADGDAVEKIIFDTLTELADKGIDGELIDAAIHQMEFHRKEVTNTPYPYGIKLLMTFAGSWFHGGDPLRILEFDDDLRRIEEARAKGGFFEGIIRKSLIDNPHRVRFHLVPDHEMTAREAEAEKAELEKIRKTLTEADIQKIQEDAEALARLQEAEEDLSVLPTLELSDIPPLSVSVSPGASRGDMPAQWYEQPTSGIFYYSMVAGAGRLPANLLPWVPFFCRAYSKVGTKRRDYTEMARRIDLYTGGLGLSAQTRTRFEGDGGCLPFVMFSGKSLMRNQEKLFDIIQEMICDVDFADLDRLKQLLLEYRAALTSMIVSNGHAYAMTLAARNFSVVRNLNETWKGIRQFQMIKDVTDDLTDERLTAIAGDFREIARHLFTKGNVRLAMIGDADGLSGAEAPLSAIMKAMSHAEGDGFVSPDIAPETAIPREGWSTSTAVSFVARAFETVPMRHADAPALSVISRMLRSLYLHREIREKGGAYGGFSVYHQDDGLFCLGSYRDPHIVNTLNVYDKAADFITSGDYTDEDVKEAILQVCSDFDRPDPPAQAAKRAFQRYLIGLTDEVRNRFKEDLLALDREKVMAAASRYFYRDPERQGVAVISDGEKLEKANTVLGDRKLELNRI